MGIVLETNIKYCPMCGSTVRHEIPDDDDRLRHVCHSCGNIQYQNPKLVVGCIPEWEGRILFCRRDIEPQKGKWTLPAGFMENNETAAEGAARETWEETRARVRIVAPYRVYDLPFVNQVYIHVSRANDRTSFSDNPGEFGSTADERRRCSLGSHRLSGYP